MKTLLNISNGKYNSEWTEILNSYGGKCTPNRQSGRPKGPQYIASFGEELKHAIGKSVGPQLEMV